MNERIGPLHADVFGNTVVAALRRIGFWGSVLLPVSYLPVMYVLSGTEMLGSLAALVTLNVFCLLCGRHYGV